MSEDTKQKEIQRRDDAQFQSDMKKLLQEAEDTRLGFMQQQRSRGFVSMNVGIMSILAGAGGFGWFVDSTPLEGSEFDDAGVLETLLEATDAADEVVVRSGKTKLMCEIERVGPESHTPLEVLNSR